MGGVKEGREEGEEFSCGRRKGGEGREEGEEEKKRLFVEESMREGRKGKRKGKNGWILIFVVNDRVGFFLMDSIGWLKFDSILNPCLNLHFSARYFFPFQVSSFLLLFVFLWDFAVSCYPHDCQIYNDLEIISQRCSKPVRDTKTVAVRYEAISTD